MSLQNLAKQKVDVYRLSVTTGSKKERTKVATIRIFIAPMSAHAASIAGLSISRAFQGITPATSNVLIGDYVQDAAGGKYDVQGARDYNMGSQPLIDLALQKQTQQGQI